MVSHRTGSFSSPPPVESSGVLSPLFGQPPATNSKPPSLAIPGITDPLPARRRLRASHRLRLPTERAELDAPRALL